MVIGAVRIPAQILAAHPNGAVVRGDVAGEAAALAAASGFIVGGVVSCMDRPPVDDAWAWTNQEDGPSGY